MKRLLMKIQLESKSRKGVVALLKAIFDNLHGVPKKKNRLKFSPGIWSPDRAMKAVSPA